MYAFTAVLALAVSAVAAPSPIARRGSPITPVVVSSSPSLSQNNYNPQLSGYSLNNWGGYDCLSSFDNFYGSSNYDGSQNQQVILSQTETCQTQSITLIQQQLAIITEYAKRVILTQICQVEVQTIVWSQFVSSLQSFSSDFRHVSGRSVGYDQHIASFISQVVTSSDQINLKDFGFQGYDIGTNLVAPSGYNWDSSTSQVSVEQAYIASQVAEFSSQSSVLDSSSLGHSSSLDGFSGLGVSPGTFDVGSVSKN